MASRGSFYLLRDCNISMTSKVPYEKKPPAAIKPDRKKRAREALEKAKAEHKAAFGEVDRTNIGRFHVQRWSFAKRYL